MTSLARKAEQHQAPDWSVLTLDEQELADFERCMIQPLQPTQAVRQAAEFLRSLRLGPDPDRPSVHETLNV